LYFTILYCKKNSIILKEQLLQLHNASYFGQHFESMQGVLLLTQKNIIQILNMLTSPKNCYTSIERLFDLVIS